VFASLAAPKLFYDHRFELIQNAVGILLVKRGMKIIMAVQVIVMRMITVMFSSHHVRPL